MLLVKGSREVQSHSKKLISIVVLNIAICLIIFFLASKFDSLIIRYPCVLYVCFCFGLGASFPITCSYENLEAKCILNTSIFLICYVISEYFYFENTLINQILLIREYIF